MGIRKPAVAGRFYPGDSKDLISTVNNMLSVYRPEKKNNVIGVVSPHAGYIYSGNVCAETLKSLEIPDTVIILGPNHQGQGANIAIATEDWQLPSGIVPLDTELCRIIAEKSEIVHKDDIAHQFEHSLEVQVPFLQSLNSHLHIVPIVLSQLSFSQCEQLGDDLADSINEYNKPVLILASSDMSHYESRQESAPKDKAALQQVIDLDPRGLYETILAHRISMCGMIPVTVMLHAAKMLGANMAEIIRYTDSGEVSGDTDQVVGYAGAVVYKE